MKYTFWVKVLKWFTYLSIFCFLISVVTFLSTGFFLSLIKKIPAEIWTVLSFFVSFLIYGSPYCFKRRLSFYKVEFLSGLGSIFFLTGLIGIAYIENVKYSREVHHKTLIFIAFVCYGIVGYIMNSSITWTASLISLGLFFNFIEIMSYYKIFNPRFIYMLGIILILFPFIDVLSVRLSKITETFGCLYLFISLWILRYMEEDRWFWDLIFILSSIGVMYVGFLKKNGYLLRRFGLFFFTIRMYSLYFEYLCDFKNRAHRTLFFFLLGVKFFVIGFYGERLYGGFKKYFVKSHKK